MSEVIVIAPQELRLLIQGAVAAGVKAALEKLGDSSRIMDENAAAEFLRLAPATLRRWRAIGKGPKYRKIGHLVRYDRADLEAWLSAFKKITIDSLDQ